MFLRLFVLGGLHLYLITHVSASVFNHRAFFLFVYCVYMLIVVYLCVPICSSCSYQALLVFIYRSDSGAVQIHELHLRSSHCSEQVCWIA
jgi:hypothetical protein